jgi:hypothetical protein
VLGTEKIYLLTYAARFSRSWKPIFFGGLSGYAINILGKGEGARKPIYRYALNLFLCVYQQKTRTLRLVLE